MRCLRDLRSGIASRSLRFAKLEDQIFTERRIRFYASGVAVAYGLAMAWRLVHGQWILLSDGRLRCVDFGWMWLSGAFAVAGEPAQIFDYSSFAAAQLALFGPANCPFITPFEYPPTFLFFTYILGLMPYVVAFAVWVATTLAIYAAAVYANIPCRAAIIAALAPFFVLVNADFGHNAFISAALIGFSLAFLERRPRTAGIFLGLLTYKPHLGVLFPLALLASRNWRALASAIVTSIALGIASLIAFGFAGWRSFINAILDRHSTLSPDGQVPLALHSIFGLLRWAGANGWVSWVAHLAVAAIVTIAVFTIWAKPVPYALKAAVLCVGSAMVSPYILFYDFCILSIAVAFLVRDGIVRGFLPGERTAMIVCLGSLFLVAVPIGPVICVALLFIAARRIVARRTLDQAAAAGGSNLIEIQRFAID